jgi:hypothetical protein
VEFLVGEAVGDRGDSLPLQYTQREGQWNRRRRNPSPVSSAKP